MPSRPLRRSRMIPASPQPTSANVPGSGITVTLKLPVLYNWLVSQVSPEPSAGKLIVSKLPVVLPSSKLNVSPSAG